MLNSDSANISSINSEGSHSRRGAVTVAVALGLVALGLIALDVVDPGVGPLEQPLSAHALGNHGLLWAATLSLAGLAMIGASLLWRGRNATAGPRLLTASGIALIAVVLFQTDPWYPWQYALTARGWVHVIAASAGMGGLWLAMLCTFPERDQLLRTRLGRITLSLSAAYVALLTVVLIATLVLVILGKSVPLIGLEERALTFLAIGWLLARQAIR